MCKFSILNLIIELIYHFNISQVYQIINLYNHLKFNIYYIITYSIHFHKLSILALLQQKYMSHHIIKHSNNNLHAHVITKPILNKNSKNPYSLSLPSKIVNNKYQMTRASHSKLTKPTQSSKNRTISLPTLQGNERTIENVEKQYNNIQKGVYKHKEYNNYKKADYVYLYKQKQNKNKLTLNSKKIQHEPISYNQAKQSLSILMNQEIADKKSVKDTNKQQNYSKQSKYEQIQAQLFTKKMEMFFCNRLETNKQVAEHQNEQMISMKSNQTQNKQVKKINHNRQRNRTYFSDQKVRRKPMKISPDKQVSLDYQMKKRLNIKNTQKSIKNGSSNNFKIQDTNSSSSNTYLYSKNKLTSFNTLKIHNHNISYEPLKNNQNLKVQSFTQKCIKFCPQLQKYFRGFIQYRKWDQLRIKFMPLYDFIMKEFVNQNHSQKTNVRILYFSGSLYKFVTSKPIDSYETTYLVGLKKIASNQVLFIQIDLSDSIDSITHKIKHTQSKFKQKNVLSHLYSGNRNFLKVQMGSNLKNYPNIQGNDSGSPIFKIKPSNNIKKLLNKKSFMKKASSSYQQFFLKDQNRIIQNQQPQHSVKFAWRHINSQINAIIQEQIHTNKETQWTKKRLDWQTIKVKSNVRIQQLKKYCKCFDIDFNQILQQINSTISREKNKEKVNQQNLMNNQNFPNINKLMMVRRFKYLYNKAQAVQQNRVNLQNRLQAFPYLKQCQVKYKDYYKTSCLPKLNIFIPPTTQKKPTKTVTLKLITETSIKQSKDHSKKKVKIDRKRSICRKKTYDRFERMSSNSPDFIHPKNSSISIMNIDEQSQKGSKESISDRKLKINRRNRKSSKLSSSICSGNPYKSMLSMIKSFKSKKVMLHSKTYPQLEQQGYYSNVRQFNPFLVIRINGRYVIIKLQIFSLQRQNNSQNFTKCIIFQIIGSNRKEALFIIPFELLITSSVQKIYLNMRNSLIEDKKDINDIFFIYGKISQYYNTFSNFKIMTTDLHKLIANDNRKIKFLKRPQKHLGTMLKIQLTVKPEQSNQGSKEFEKRSHFSKQYKSEGTQIKNNRIRLRKKKNYRNDSNQCLNKNVSFERNAISIVPGVYFRVTIQIFPLLNLVYFFCEQSSGKMQNFSQNKPLKYLALAALSDIYKYVFHFDSLQRYKSQQAEYHQEQTIKSLKSIIESEKSLVSLKKKQLKKIIRSRKHIKEQTQSKVLYPDLSSLSLAKNNHKNMNLILQTKQKLGKCIKIVRNMQSVHKNFEIQIISDLDNSLAKKNISVKMFPIFSSNQHVFTESDDNNISLYERIFFSQIFTPSHILHAQLKANKEFQSGKSISLCLNSKKICKNRTKQDINLLAVQLTTKRTAPSLRFAKIGHNILRIKQFLLHKATQQGVLSKMVSIVWDCCTKFQSGK